MISVNIIIIYFIITVRVPPPPPPPLSYFSSAVRVCELCIYKSTRSVRLLRARETLTNGNDDEEEKNFDSFLSQVARSVLHLWYQPSAAASAASSCQQLIEWFVRAFAVAKRNVLTWVEADVLISCSVSFCRVFGSRLTVVFSHLNSISSRLVPSFICCREWVIRICVFIYLFNRWCFVLRRRMRRAMVD